MRLLISTNLKTKKVYRDETEILQQYYNNWNYLQKLAPFIINLYFLGIYLSH